MSVASPEIALTERHRRAQLQIKARTLRDLARIWSLWKVNDPKSFREFALAAGLLVHAYRGLSANVAAAYYRGFRAAEQIEGIAAPQLASAITPEEILASLYVTGRAMNGPPGDGISIDTLRKDSYVRVSGALTRHVLNGGRQTILNSVAADRRARGWARITDGNPCYFCLTLASRGAVYKTEETAGFQAHDHCGCAAMPVFDGTVIPSLDQWRQIYDDAQRHGLDTGLLQHGQNSSKARLNAVRRYLAVPHTH